MVQIISVNMVTLEKNDVKMCTFLYTQIMQFKTEKCLLLKYNESEKNAELIS